LEACGPCPVFASVTLAFALELRKKDGKPLVSVVEESTTRQIFKNSLKRLPTQSSQEVTSVLKIGAVKVFRE